MHTVVEYLNALPSDLREVHKLRYEEGLSQIQAAERLGVGRQSLRTLEARLRDGLSAALDAAGLEGTANPGWLGTKVMERKWAR
jgi:DNA-directed RNA polymerase specialized sigma24 family protein